jgi:hypothetical protein
MPNTPRSGLKGMIAAGFLASSVLTSAALAQSDTQDERSAPATTAATANATGPSSPYRPDRFAGRARKYYEFVWGVDSLAVKTVESGQLIRFTYRVLDAERAKAINNKDAEPYLIAPRAGVVLVVPQMEKIGKLRQSGSAEAGKSYWMTFSNKGRLVKRGDRVDVMIGHFRADGLVVD